MFKDIFNEIVIRYIEEGLVTGEDIVSDWTFIPANAAKNSKIIVIEAVEKRAINYMDELNEELSHMNGYKKSEPKLVEKELYKCITDVEYGYVNQPNKKGLGYMAKMSADIKNGIITGTDVFLANTMEHTIILNHIKNQILAIGLSIKNLVLDG